MNNRHRIWGPIAALAAVLAVAAPASADSIVYEKGGNVWLTSPDGSKQYQVTSDGDWASPSQADDGMIVARKRTMLVRMTRSGRIIGQVEALGGATTINPAPSDADKFYGPWEPKVSPDGTRIAYVFGQYENYHSVPCNCILWGLMHYTTTTAVDHLDSSPQNSIREDESPSWIDNRRLLTWDPYFLYQASTWVAGGNYSNQQWWFTYPNALLRDGELSPDGSKVVAVGATNGIASPYNTLLYWTTNGPAWAGEPPYAGDINQPSPVAEPTVRCQNVRDSDAHDPSWSPDSKSIAYDDKDGIWIQQVGALNDACDGLTEKLLVPGAETPDWGPADVDMADRPGTAATSTRGPGLTKASPTTAGGGARLSKLRISPKRFRVAAARGAHRRAGARVTFRTTAALRVTLQAERVSGRRSRAVPGAIVVAAHPGTNTVRLTGRLGGRALRPGHYVLIVDGAVAPARVAFEIRR